MTALDRKAMHDAVDAIAAGLDKADEARQRCDQLLVVLESEELETRVSPENTADDLEYELRRIAALSEIFSNAAEGPNQMQDVEFIYFARTIIDYASTCLGHVEALREWDKEARASV